MKYVPVCFHSAYPVAGYSSNLLTAEFTAVDEETIQRTISFSFLCSE